MERVYAGEEEALLTEDEIIGMYERHALRRNHLLVVVLLMSALVAGLWHGYEERPAVERLLATKICQGCDLSRSNLAGICLSRANLKGATLKGADLSVADLSHADLRDADLSGASLYRANLSGADLRGANVAGVHLLFADVSGEFGQTGGHARRYGGDLRR